MIIKRLFYITIVALLGSVVVINAAYAQENTVADSVDEDKLAERIKNEIMQELRDSGFLAEQIQQGIQEYIKQQREDQAKTREEQQKKVAELAKNVRPVSTQRDHIRGDSNAKISLIEYSDFECPYCKRFHATAQKVVDSYEGKVNWVYRHYPLAFHNPGAQKQAEASECAADIGSEDAFWTYVDVLYERTESGGKGFPIDNLVPLAKEIGLDETAFKNCLDEEKYATRVKEDFDDGASAGIRGTPGNILLNAETGEVAVVSGAVPFARLKAEIDKML